jgi:hypothetical protein
MTEAEKRGLMEPELYDALRRQVGDALSEREAADPPAKRELRKSHTDRALSLFGAIESSVPEVGEGMYSYGPGGYCENLEENAAMGLLLGALGRRDRAEKLADAINKTIKKGGHGLYLTSCRGGDELTSTNAAMVAMLCAVGRRTEAEDLFRTISSSTPKGDNWLYGWRYGQRYETAEANAMMYVAMRALGMDYEAGELMASLLGAMRKGKHGMYLRGVLSKTDETEETMGNAAMALALGVAGMAEEAERLLAAIERSVPKGKSGLYGTKPGSTFQFTSATAVVCLAHLSLAGADLLGRERSR